MWHFLYGWKLKNIVLFVMHNFCVCFWKLNLHPACRILSDCIPIKGRKRIPYLVIATFLSLVPWPMLGIDSNLRSSQWHLTVLLTVQNLGSAMADVVVDAMIAEAVRSERYVCMLSLKENLSTFPLIWYLNLSSFLGKCNLATDYPSYFVG